MLKATNRAPSFARPSDFTTATFARSENALSITATIDHTSTKSYLLPAPELTLKPSPFQPTDRILVVGCGNSPFTAALYDDGFKDVTSIDFSPTVIKAMAARHAEVSQTILTNTIIEIHVARPSIQGLHYLYYSQHGSHY